jgi:hypothetical protein
MDMKKSNRYSLAIMCSLLVLSCSAAFSLHAQQQQPGIRVQRPIPSQTPTPQPTPFKRVRVTGNESVSEKATIRPYTQERLILSAEGSYGFQPVVSGKINVGQTSDGEIWLAISYEDGTPFTQARAGDIRIETLSNGNGSGVVARLDPSLSRASDGVWHFTLPQINPGSHFYLIRVLVDNQDGRTTYGGQTIVRASYTRMPYWNAQRVDGTVWEPPK